VLTAACLFARFEIGSRLSGVAFIEMRKGFLILRIFIHATFFHLALVTVLVLFESSLELVISLSLHEPDSILIKQCFDLACCLSIIR